MTTNKSFNEVSHEHKFEFDYSDNDTSVFRCTVDNCKAVIVEHEDTGTGA